jgi:hypothetical protein
MSCRLDLSILIARALAALVGGASGAWAANCGPDNAAARDEALKGMIAAEKAAYGQGKFEIYVSLILEALFPSRMLTPPSSPFGQLRTWRPLLWAISYGTERGRREMKIRHNTVSTDTIRPKSTRQIRCKSSPVSACSW